MLFFPAIWGPSINDVDLWGGGAKTTKNEGGVTKENVIADHSTNGKHFFYGSFLAKHKNISKLKKISPRNNV